MRRVPDVQDASIVLCVEWLVSVARRLMTVTAASDKRINGGEDVILDEDMA